MKIYQHIPNEIIRVQIIRTGDESKFLNIVEATQNEVIEKFTEILKDTRVPAIFPTRTDINIREAKGGKNGKSKSISIKGLSPQEIYDLFTTQIKKENEEANTRNI